MKLPLLLMTGSQYNITVLSRHLETDTEKRPKNSFLFLVITNTHTCIQSYRKNEHINIVIEREQTQGSVAYDTTNNNIVNAYYAIVSTEP